MIYKEENSYINESESISIGNKVLYDLCKSYPMNDDVNGMIAKLWLIGKSYSTSIDRRNYGKEYSKIDIGGTKLNLNTGSNGTDSYFKTVSNTIINDEEYQNLLDKIYELKNKKFNYIFKDDKEILEEICNLIFKFNSIIRRSIEKVDENALKEFENKNAKFKQDRNLINFISFSSKFLHFHLPNIVFIIDQFSSNHAKSIINKKIVLKDSNRNIIFEISKLNVKTIKYQSNNYKEKDYVHHVEKCYAIMCKLHEIYKSNISPRMVDNFLMKINV